MRLPKMFGPAGYGLYPARCYVGRVVAVDTVAWTVSVVTLFSQKTFYDIQVASPYLHFYGGEGVYVMPEIGALALVLSGSEGPDSPSYVIGYIAPNSAEPVTSPDGEQGPAQVFAAARPPMNPGDVMLRTRDENFVIVRRGGVVQIGASAICQRFYIPIGNLIRDVFENYEAVSTAGELRWLTHRTDQTKPSSDPTDVPGDALTSMVWRVRSTAADKSYAVELRAGSHPDDPDERFRLEVRPKGEKDIVALLTIDRTGALSWNVAGEVRLTYDAAVHVVSAEDVEVACSKALNVTAKSLTLGVTDDASISAKNLELVVTDKLRASARSVVLEGRTQIGGGGGQPLVLGDELVSILQELLQSLSGAGTPSVPASIGQPVIFPVAQKLLARLGKVLSRQHTVT